LKSIADSYRVNAARVYMEKKNYADAKQVLDSVLDNSDLRFNVKNIAEDLLAEVNYHLN
jgi:predicted negative regulator of RcsB-dependent stress response